MTDNTKKPGGPEPCRRCGAPVREVRERSAAQGITGQTDYIVRRVCRNPKCPTNAPVKAITDNP